jgi:hypothetical protein
MSSPEVMKRMAKIVNNFLARPDSGPFREPVDWRGLELYDYPTIIKKMMDLGTIKRKLDRNQYESAAAVAYDIRLVWKNCMTYNAEGSDFWHLAKSYSKRFEDQYRRIRNKCKYMKCMFLLVVNCALRCHRQCIDSPVYYLLFSLHTTSVDVGEELVDTEEEESEEESDEEEIEAEEEEAEEEEEEEEEEDDEEEMEFEGPPKRKSSHGGPKDAGRKTPPPSKLDARARFASNLLLLSGVELGFVISALEEKCPSALEINQSGGQLLVPDKMEINTDVIDTETFGIVSQYAAEKAAARTKGPHKVQIAAAAVTPRTTDVSNARRKRKR